MNKNNTTLLTTHSAPWVVKTQIKNEQEEHVKHLLISRFVRIYNENNTQDYCWVGSSADFWQLVYMVYREVLLFDSTGCPLSLKHISQNFCTLLGMKMIKNPAALGLQATNRKGIKKPNIVKRYVNLLKINLNEEPLSAELKHTENTH